MERSEIKRLIAWLQTSVKLGGNGPDITITFDQPEADDFLRQGFGKQAVALTIEKEWWREMISDIIETPEFSEPDDSPEHVLQYSRDVVSEYIRKRFGT